VIRLTFVAVIGIGWIWLGLWASKLHPGEKSTRRTSWAEDLGAGLMQSWLGPWHPYGSPAQPIKLDGIERLRNGWIYLAGTMLAVAMTFLIYH
jgi:hypothetical protein